MAPRDIGSQNTCPWLVTGVCEPAKYWAEALKSREAQSLSNQAGTPVLFRVLVWAPPPGSTILPSPPPPCPVFCLLSAGPLHRLGWAPTLLGPSTGPASGQPLPS